MDQPVSIDTGENETGDADEFSWRELGRIALIALTVALVAPVAITLLLAFAWLLLPMLFIALPFILPETLAEGAAEHMHRRERGEPPNAPSHAH